MSAKPPTSATTLPASLPNVKAPLCTIEDESLNNPTKVGIVTQAWRYFFGSLAQKTTSISASWTTNVSNPPTQAQVQAIVAQVQLLSKQLAGSK